MRNLLLLGFLSMASASCSDGEVDLNGKCCSLVDNGLDCEVWDNQNNVAFNGGANCPEGDIVIPDDRGITKINYNALKDCHKMTSLVLPEGVTVIESGAFELTNNIDASNDDELISVTFPSTLVQIKNYVFMNRRHLATIDLSRTKLKEMGYAVFTNIRVEKIILPRTLKIVDDDYIISWNGYLKQIIYMGSKPSLARPYGSNGGQPDLPNCDQSDYTCTEKTCPEDSDPETCECTAVQVIDDLNTCCVSDDLDCANVCNGLAVLQPGVNGDEECVETIVWTITMTDDFGDGWNGFTLLYYTPENPNGVPLTMETGSYDTLEVPNLLGTEVYADGDYPGEITYTVTLGDVSIDGEKAEGDGIDLCENYPGKPAKCWLCEGTTTFPTGKCDCEGITTLPEGKCDCDGNDLDVCGVCGGSGDCTSGCTNSAACNYDPTAAINDGSCLLQCIYGCTDSTAFNYNSNANMDDGSCITAVYGCTDSTAGNYNSNANTDDGSCLYTKANLDAAVAAAASSLDRTQLETAYAGFCE